MKKQIEGYIPYGKEWEKALMRYSKKALINILRNQLKKQKKQTDFEKVKAVFEDIAVDTPEYGVYKNGYWKGNKFLSIFMGDEEFVFQFSPDGELYNIEVV